MEIKLGSGDIEIGYVENTKNDCIVMWFYRKQEDKWIKVREERCHKKHREYHLRRIMRKSKLVILGRGT